MSRCLTIFCSTKLVALVYEPRTKEEEKNVERLKFKQNKKECLQLLGDVYEM